METTVADEGRTEVASPLCTTSTFAFAFGEPRHFQCRTTWLWRLQEAKRERGKEVKRKEKVPIPHNGGLTYRQNRCFMLFIEK